MDAVLAFIIFWGVWIIFPFIIDGAQVILQAFGAIITRRFKKTPKVAYQMAEQLLPMVSVIIPTFNEERNVDQCLNSLKVQSYPHRKLEILVVDDGSSDRTVEFVRYHLEDSDIPADEPSSDGGPPENKPLLFEPCEPQLAPETESVVKMHDYGGRAVVAADTAGPVGRAIDMLVEKQSQCVRAILVKADGDGRPLVVPFSDCWLGRHAIMLESAEVAQRVQLDDLDLDRYWTAGEIFALEVLSSSGERLGAVTDIELASETGRIVHYGYRSPEGSDAVLRPERVAGHRPGSLVLGNGNSHTTGHRHGQGYTAGNGDGASADACVVAAEAGPGSDGPALGRVKIRDRYYEFGEFEGVIRLIAEGHAGKATALNKGIGSATGDIVVTLDCDAMLAPRAIQDIVNLFLADENMGAATGSIEVCPDIVEEVDEQGEWVEEEGGGFAQKKLSLSETILSKCQFLEYLSAFHIGRQHQAATNTIYTLAGAFSAFRRDVLLKTSLYRSTTVSEDTDLTLEIHRQGYKLGYAPEAKAVIKPTLAWSDLYSQRVRWMRGQLEVVAAHRDMLGMGHGMMGSLAMPRMLAIDHTLSFPRVIWTLMLPLLVLFGYSTYVVMVAMTLMYAFYVGLEFLVVMSCYAVADRDAKEEIIDNLHYCFIMPFYRFVTFYFRLSGYLRALNDPPEWSVEDPMSSMKQGAQDLALKAATFAAAGLRVISLTSVGSVVTYWLSASVGTTVLVISQKYHSLGIDRIIYAAHKLSGSLLSLALVLAVLGIILYFFGSSTFAAARELIGR